LELADYNPLSLFKAAILGVSARLLNQNKEIEKMKSKIEPATVTWDENGTPLSTQFNDPYFSRKDGLAESTQVFLETNRLPQRFADLSEGENFVIAETGFGTGLNFLLTWRCFKQYAPATARLSYISVEGYPLRPEDLHKCLQQWPELSELSTELEAHYPVLVPGHHWRLFEGRIGLQLIFDQLTPALQSLHPQISHHNWLAPLVGVDAWFLDGFAPAKNPDMWQDSIYPSIARLSHPNTSLSSFTAASAVRRNLESWGFVVDKIPGFGQKREMISAQFEKDWSPSKEQIRAHTGKNSQSWHLPTQDKTPSDKEQPKEVSILGAGIAGLCTAKALATRGIKVTIFDKRPSALQGASGNPQVAIFGRLSPDSGDLEDFVMQCLAHSADFYKEYWQSDCGENAGLLQLSRNDSELKKMHKIVELLPINNGLIRFIKAINSKEICGIELDTDGLWFPNSGWISPPELASSILSSDLIEFKGNTVVNPQFKDGLWLLLDQGGTEVHRCKPLIVCNGAESLEGDLLDWLPIKPVAGQVSLTKASKETSALTAILSKTTSIAPSMGDTHCLGGTYRLGETSLDVRDADTAKNLANVNEFLGLESAITAPVTESRVGVRATTPDYLPICGAATDIEKLKVDFEPLSRDAKWPMSLQAPALEGLYLNLGYGSRGYAYAPLCAEHISSIVCGGSSPLPNHLQRAVHPARFPIRNIIRGK
jgi:tRNA 5-methylaminomethyl-2-thiouridine biosynthesis bifunctional protein